MVCTSHVPNQDGYIRIFQGSESKKRYEMLHRMSWMQHKGAIPSGMEVDHKCRNRRCCNPEHLQLLSVSEHKSKTNRERYADRIEGIVSCILNEEKSKDIAEKFGVSAHTVNFHKRRITGVTRKFTWRNRDKQRTD